MPTKNAPSKRQSNVIVVKCSPSVSVKIYPIENKATGYKSFQVADHSSGKRKLISLSDETEARRKAKEIGDRIAAGDKAVLQLRDADKHAYVRTLDVLRPTGKSLEIAAIEYAEAMKELNGAGSLLEAVRFFVKRGTARIIQKTVPEVVDEMLLAKEKAGLSASYLALLKSVAGKFKTAFQTPISNVGVHDVLALLEEECDLEPRSYNNVVDEWRHITNFAKARGYLAKDHDAMTGIEKIKLKGGSVSILTPEEMAKLLQAADADFLPCLALAGFAGIRSFEINRLKWEDVHLALRVIEVGANVAKTASHRHAPITDNLAAILAPYADRKGKLWPHEIDFYFETLAETAKTAKVEWKRNSPRHSFCTYRVAQTQNVNQVALEAGNTPKMIFKHYRRPITADRAAAWFSIGLPTDGKVTQLPVAEAAQN